MTTPASDRSPATSSPGATTIFRGRRRRSLSLTFYAEYEEVTPAVSIDEGTGSQARDRAGAAGASPALTATETGPTKRRRVSDEERRLVEEGRQRVGKAREHLDEHARGLLDVERHVAERVKASTPGNIWSRLNAIDFMNSSMVFSALAVLCLFPFLFIVAAKIGGDARPALIRRLGLDQNAAKSINSLMSPGTHAATTLDLVGAVWILLGAIGIASTLQVWYQKVYDQPPGGNKIRHLIAQLVWVTGLVVYLAVQDFFNRDVTQVGVRVLIYAVFFAVAVAFYWWTQHILLIGRVRWGHLFPGAVATGVCVTGLSVFSAWLFSGQIVSSDRDYGSIGVVTVLMSYMIGYGVCLHIGAVAGRVWGERRQPAAPDDETGEPSPLELGVPRPQVEP
jgi:membrane protein